MTVTSQSLSKPQFSQIVKGPDERCDWCDADIPREAGGHAARGRNDFICHECGSPT